jgi:23S rRNA pseudouridine955/2504/2580 synthase
MSPSSPGKEMIAGPDDAGRRLDKVLRVVLKDKNLSQVYAALRKGRIRVNGSKAEPDSRVTEGDRIFVDAALLSDRLDPEIAGASGGLMEIADILVLATADLLFVNKPRGLLSQGDDGLEGRIRRALASRTASSLSFVPGPLHRLDRNTTGLLAFPRSAGGARAFTALVRDRLIRKRYLALVDGEAVGPAEWRDRIGRDGRERTSFVEREGGRTGEEAYSEARPLLRSGGRSLLLVEIRTGLTHQIRVQASARGMPLSGDAKYGGRPLAGGYILHAYSLSFPEPPFADLPETVVAPLPESARERLAGLFGPAELRAALEGLVGRDRR